MLKLLSWIGGRIGVSSLLPFALVVAGVSISVGTYLYLSLVIEKHEKEQALAQIVTLESTITALEKARDTDNKIANLFMQSSNILDTINMQTAIEIAGIPKLDWEQNHEQIEGYSKEQKSIHNETHTFTLDTPLPRLSVPLIMLYNEVSRAHNATASRMDNKGKRTAKTSRKDYDSSPTRTVD